MLFTWPLDTFRDNTVCIIYCWGADNSLLRRAYYLQHRGENNSLWCLYKAVISQMEGYISICSCAFNILYAVVNKELSLQHLQALVLDLYTSSMNVAVSHKVWNINASHNPTAGEEIDAISTLSRWAPEISVTDSECDCVFRDCGVEQWAKRQVGMKIKNHLLISAHYTFMKNWQDK